MTEFMTNEYSYLIIDILSNWRSFYNTRYFKDESQCNVNMRILPLFTQQNTFHPFIMSVHL